MSAGLSPLRDRDHPSARRLDVRRAVCPLGSWVCLLVCCPSVSWLLGPSAGVLLSSLLGETASFPAVLPCLPPFPDSGSLSVCLRLSHPQLLHLSVSVFLSVFPRLHSPSHSGPKTQQLPAAPPLLLHPGTPHPTRSLPWLAPGLHPGPGLQNSGEEQGGAGKAGLIGRGRTPNTRPITTL